MRLFISIILILAAPTLWAQNDTLLLSEALEIGLENNFSIRLAQQETQIATNNITLGNAGFLPTVDASLSRSNSVQGVNQEFITGNTNKLNGAKSNAWNAGTALNWTLFDGLAMFTTYEKLQELREVGEQNSQVIITDALAQISATYYELVQQDQLLAVYRENVKLSVERVELSKEQYTIGSASKREWLLAQVDVNADSSVLIQQEGLVARTKTLLNQFLGRDPATRFEVSQQIDLLPKMEYELIKYQMLAQNPAMLQAQQLQRVSLLELKEIQAERLPELGVNLGYTYNKSSSEAGFLLSNRVTGINYGVSAGINLFNGFNLRRRVQNAKVQMATTSIENEALQHDLETRLLDAFLNYENTLRLLKLERANLAVSQQNLDIARQTYELGELSSIEFREAQTNHVASENRLITALYRVKLNEIELMRLSGKPL